VLATLGGPTGFSIEDPHGNGVAYRFAATNRLNLTSGWSFEGSAGTSTTLNNLYSLQVDVASTDPAHQGDTFPSGGVHGISGATSRRAVP
jgi:hypothetical protein